jgi:hypothetical protein
MRSKVIPMSSATAAKIAQLGVLKRSKEKGPGIKPEPFRTIGNNSIGNCMDLIESRGLESAPYRKQ